MDEFYKQKETLLVVDDVTANIDVLDGILNREYNIKVATSGPMAVEIAFQQETPDLILLDVMMPGMDGYEVCQILKENYKTRKVPVVFVTAKGDVLDEARGFDVGAVDYILKPVNPLIVKARVRTQLALYNQKRLLETMVKERTVELHDTRLEIIRKLGRAAEYKDNETGMHVIRMSKYCQLVAERLGLGKETAELFMQAAPMHDIGKIGIPDSVLLKPGKLDQDEWVKMQTHCEIGAQIIGEGHSTLLEAAYTAALTHHEKWDGSGYPNGLAGEAIPLIGRVVALGDVFDALTSERPYKKAWSIDRAVDLIKEESGKHFDPQLLGPFLEVLPEVLKVKASYADEVAAMSV